MFGQSGGGSVSAWKRQVQSGEFSSVSAQPLLQWVERRGLPLEQCHTSGHASVADLLKLRNAFPRAPVVPIHTDRPERFGEVFGNVRQRADGEWWEVERLRSEERTSDDNGIN
jgi:ribonuclease J